MNIAKLRGMRFPDEYIIRMFYKEHLNQAPGRVLEIGCNSANNLLLFAGYGWEITGIDYDAEAISNATHNLNSNSLTGTLLQHDLSKGMPSLDGLFDAFLAPSVLYYLPKEDARACLEKVRTSLAPKAIIYLRMRLPDDYRYGKGIPYGQETWKIDYPHTGEENCINSFWEEDKLIDLVHETLGIKPENLTTLKVRYENIQNSIKTSNSDIILWGRVS